MRTSHLFALGLALMLAVVAVTSAGGQSGKQETEYMVVYAEGASLTAARQAVAAAGGTIVSENTDVGVATVTSSNPAFLAAVANQSAALYGASTNRPIGYAEPLEAAKPDDVEHLSAAETAGLKPAKVDSARKKGGGASIAATPDPLASLQWDMEMIHATATGSYAKDQGDPGVLVGIIDTGVDGSHPDIAPNFSLSLSRNFVTDIPGVDGPACEVPSCVDPVDVDDGAHGTHVAGIVGAALNGLGTAGVAPKATLVNIRAGQDSGFFFLQPTVDALTYAGNAGIDVVNMSYFVDPWLFNCTNNPADSPTQQMEQRTIIEGTTRALRFAHRHHVTLVASEGNEHTNLDAATHTDTISPDYPEGTSYPRTVDGSCLVLPHMGPHVLSISAIGPSGIKADYSNYGFDETVVAAPGGYFRDFFGTPKYRTLENQVLSAYPQHIAEEEGQLNPDGTPNTPQVVRSCQGSVCGYYQWLQGTSMAAPHATGVAALIVSHFGHRQGGRGGKDQLEMNPERVEKILTRTASDHACPVPATVDYTIVGRPAEFNATCAGTTDENNFYGEGVVDALAAVSFKDKD